MAKRSVWKGIVAGAVGGLAASFVMNQFQRGWSKIAERSNPEDQIQMNRDDPSTVKGADKLYVAFRGEHIPEDKKEKYGNLLHYATGVLAGMGYGVLSDFKPRTRAGFGSAFGSVLFVGADEIAVPLAGLSKGPKEYPVKTHVYALLSHLVFGSALEATRLGTRKALAKATHERKPLQLRKRAQRAIKAFAA
jgi:putative membrane protein